MRTPVILDVNPDPEALEWEQEFLTRLDVPVIGCCGPDARGGCPLLVGEPCPKIEAADGVIFQLDLDKADHRRILAMYAQQLDVPIRIVVSEEQRRRWAHLVDMVEVFVPPVGPATLDAFAAEVESEVE
jgi:hypothetical protein